MPLANALPIGFLLLLALHKCPYLRSVLKELLFPDGHHRFQLINRPVHRLRVWRQEQSRKTDCPSKPNPKSTSIWTCVQWVPCASFPCCCPSSAWTQPSKSSFLLCCTDSCIQFFFADAIHIDILNMCRSSERVDLWRCLLVSHPCKIFSCKFSAMCARFACTGVHACRKFSQHLN